MTRSPCCSTAPAWAAITSLRRTMRTPSLTRVSIATGAICACAPPSPASRAEAKPEARGTAADANEAGTFNGFLRAPSRGGRRRGRGPPAKDKQTTGLGFPPEKGGRWGGGGQGPVFQHSGQTFSILFHK